MGIKRKLIALSLGSILVLTGSVGSFAYLKSQDNIKSKVQTGTFPRCKVKIYASIGPLYNNCIWGKNNKESEFYKPWLNNANKYIKEDIIGKRNDIIGSGKAKFQNIENNNKNPITAKAIIGTWMTNEHSWMGDKDVYGNENGSMIHYLVAISNGANEGVQRRKLDFKKSEININQKDIFKTNKMGKEYSVYRKRCLNTSKIDLKDQDKRRIRTYSWNGKEYIENGSYGNPSHSADLIVSDVGNNVYYSMDGSKKGLQKTYNMLTGKEDMYAINKKWQWVTKLLQ